MTHESLVQQFKSAPAGKLYCLHGTGSVFGISLAAAAHVLLNGLPVTLVDGTNRFDAYYLAEFARKHAGVRPDGRRVTPEDFLDNIFVSRAFTCYQMEAVITERLPMFVRRSGSPVVIILGLLDTFYDEQAPLFEVKAGLQRIVGALRALRGDNVAVLLASMDVRLASKERNGLFPSLMTSMDRVYHVTGDKGEQRIVNEGDITGRIHGKDSADIYDGHPAGNGKLGKIPPGIAQG